LVITNNNSSCFFWHNNSFKPWIRSSTFHLHYILSDFNFSRAFTLVELLDFVAIIGILAAVGMTTFNGFQEKTKVAATKANLQSVIKYIKIELMKCELDETIVMDGYLNCTDTRKGGVDLKAHNALNIKQNFKDKNPYGVSNKTGDCKVT
tara:strand:- start:13 stop:462 length:450 start_codon:yes stop_codon:yes gene_type:complete